MNIEEIQILIANIKAIADDDQEAHRLEAQLRDDFIAYVATLEIPSLAEKAHLVLSTAEIDFCRWYG